MIYGTPELSADTGYPEVSSGDSVSLPGVDPVPLGGASRIAAQPGSRVEHRGIGPLATSLQSKRCQPRRAPQSGQATRSLVAVGAKPT